MDVIGYVYTYMYTHRDTHMMIIKEAVNLRGHMKNWTGQGVGMT